MPSQPPGQGGHDGDPDPSVVSWHVATVAGHRVRYAAVGVGPDALFLHGWGLRPNAYLGAVRAMAAAGCRVVAPALPGFGGTRDLPADERTFPGYGAWVAAFLDAVGIGRASLVVGHSFGGGVATAFAHLRSERVGSLLLCNAVGSPTWTLFPDEVRTMVQRPLWDWAHHFGADVFGSPGLLRLLPTLAEDFIPNVLTNPLGMMRTGAFIRRADLVAEIGDVAGRGVPVQVVWSDRDGLVPRSAFDDLRHAAGVDGVVVEGAHAWLIADPGAFGELAIGALVDSGDLTRRAAV